MSGTSRSSGADAGPSAPEIHVLADGSLVYLWDDRLQPLGELGAVSIRRASHVEPDGGGWTADLAPVGGPRLGPFRLRAEALAAERRWLHRHLGEPGVVAPERRPEAPEPPAAATRAG